MTMTPVTLLKNTITEAGGIMPFRKSMGVTHQAVYSWMRRGYVPLERAATIEALYNVPMRSLIDPRVARALSTATSSDIL
jgi:hypothetical protein